MRLRVSRPLWSVAGALLAWPLGAQAPAASGYVDPLTCAECHVQIAESYRLTGMGRSFRSLRADSSMREFDAAPFSHLESGERFTPLKRDGKYFVRREAPSGFNALEVSVDYVMGSGNRAKSYLHRTADQKLVEFPVSWYSENGGHWGMSPGYDRPGHQGFSREVSYRCMFCHNGYPEIDARAAEWESGTLYPSWLPEGIDCQRCHGPGKRHVDASRRGDAAQRVRAAILNPARLSPERRMEVCMQCHLEATSSPLPAALMRFGRSVFSYRPGEALGDFLLYFDHASGSGYDDKFEIVSAAYRFRKSACFQKSAGRFECTTCHDPHQASPREKTVEKTQRACLGCHSTLLGQLTRQGGTRPRGTVSPATCRSATPRT